MLMHHICHWSVQTLLYVELHVQVHQCGSRWKIFCTYWLATATLTVYTNLSSFTVDWYADPPCYTMSVSTPSHMHVSQFALIDLKFMLFVLFISKMTREFNPTAACLCKFISGTFHLNFILQNSWHHCCKVSKEVTWC